MDLDMDESQEAASDADVDVEVEVSSSGARTGPGSAADTDSMPIRSRYACTHATCNKTFSRQAHMKRHALSHVDEKPYKCEICSSAYARQDVYARHKAQHAARDAEALANGSYPARGRTRLACEQCAKAKSKCSGTLPCERCKTAGKDCTYPSTNGPQAESSLPRPSASILPDIPPNLSVPDFADLNTTAWPEANSFYDLDMLNTLQPTPSTSYMPLPLSSSNVDASTSMATNQALGQLALDGSIEPSNWLFHPDLYSFSAPASVPNTEALHFQQHQPLQVAAAPPPAFNDVDLDFLDLNYLDFLFPDSKTEAIFPLCSTTTSSHGPLVHGHTSQPLASSRAHTRGSLAPSIGLDAEDQSGSNELFRRFQTASHATLHSKEDQSSAAEALRALGNNDDNGPHFLDDPRTRGNSPVPITSKVLDTDLYSNAIPSVHEPEALSSMERLHIGPRTVIKPLLNNPFLTLFPVPSVAEDPSLAGPPGIAFEQTSLTAVLEMLHYSRIRQSAYHDVYGQMARIPLRRYSDYCDIYVQRVHHHLPVLHLPTFEARRASGFLLCGIVMMGAQYHMHPASARLAYLLAEVVFSAAGTLLSLDTSLSRNQELWQTYLMWTLIRYTGVRRLLELVDVFRNTLTVSLAKLHAFDGTIVPLDVITEKMSTEKKWLAWKTRESRLRTGFACFLADAEFTIFLDRQGMMVPSELQSQLPCADSLWEAPTHHDWWQALPQHPTRLPAAHLLFQGNPASPEYLAAARASSFASTILVQLVHVSLWYLRASGCLSPTTLRAGEADILRTLSALGNGPNEFSPSLASPLTTGWTGYAILYHLCHISIRIPLTSLLKAAGKKGKADAARTRKMLYDQLREDRKAARTLAMHAGQCFRHIRDEGSGAPFEIFSLFFAGLCLYLYAVAFEADKPSDETSSTFLDCAKPSIYEVAWTLSDTGTANINGRLLNSKAAGIDLLNGTVDLLTKKQVWGMRWNLIRLLRALTDAQE